MSEASRDLPERPTARVLLLDSSDRILLMKGRPPGGAKGSGAWFTVGGGVEPGETFIAAAAREVREETGIADVVLGPVVWLREGVMRMPQPMLFKERYILARCDGGELSREGWNAAEREFIEDVRWWSHADLVATSERVFPLVLIERLPDLIAGRLPAEPVEIPWL